MLVQQKSGVLLHLYVGPNPFKCCLHDSAIIHTYTAVLSLPFIPTDDSQIQAIFQGYIIYQESKKNSVMTNVCAYLLMTNWDFIKPNKYDRQF